MSQIETYLSVARPLLRVTHDLRRLDWEESDIFVFLAVSHVDFAPLALPEVGHGARPNSRPDTNDAILLRTMKRVGHCVLEPVPVAAEDPCGVVALACPILSDGFQAWLIWVQAQHSIDFFLTVFGLLTKGMTHLVDAKNILGVMDPAGLVRHLLSRWERNLRGVTILNLIRLDLQGQFRFLLSLRNLVHSDGRQLSGVVDPRNLSAQIVLFPAEVERVRHDLALEVTSEADLNLAGSGDVIRIQVGQDRPRALSLIGYIVGVLIAALTTSFTTFRSSVLGQVLCVQGLNNIVVLDSTGNLTPELEAASFARGGELLQRLLQDDCAILAQLNASLVEHMPVKRG